MHALSRSKFIIEVAKQVTFTNNRTIFFLLYQGYKTEASMQAKAWHRCSAPKRFRTSSASPRESTRRTTALSTTFLRTRSWTKHSMSTRSRRTERSFGSINSNRSGCPPSSRAGKSALVSGQPPTRSTIFWANFWSTIILWILAPDWSYPTTGCSTRTLIWYWPTTINRT